MTSVTIRQAVRGDLDAVRELYRAASLSNPGDRPLLLANPEFLHWDGELLARGRTKVAVETPGGGGGSANARCVDGDGATGGRIVGFASTLVDDDALELEDLFVDPERRREGIARRLVADAVALARELGLSRMQVTANPHAMEFYESVGFVASGRIKTQLGSGQRMWFDCRLPAAVPPDRG